jgi:hypothetical protein
MTELFLKLLGARAEDVVRVAETSLAFRGGLGTGWVLLSLLAVGGATYWMYRPKPALLTPARHYTLLGLRLFFVVLVLVLLLRPVLSLTVEGSVRRMLVVLLDGSASMEIRDPRVELPDRKRAAIARGDLDPDKGLGQELNVSPARTGQALARIEMVRSILKNERLNLLPRLDREYDLSAFSFGEGLVEISARKHAAETNGEPRQQEVTVDDFPWVGELKSASPLTALGDALREVMNRKRGQPLAGIFLLTDGANNSGCEPREMASLCRQEGLPLYIYGVGITSPRDIIVGNLFAPDVTFVKDEVPVTVRLRVQGLVGQEAELVLQLANQKVASKTITFDAEGELVIPMSFTPSSEGDFDLVASIAPRPDETVQDNNTRSHRLRVVDAKIKVLLVDQSPRWEFRYLQAMLLRDRRVDLKCWLVEGDPEISRSEDSPYLENFPARKEDLFQYDLVIYGDVDPKAISASQLENLAELVSRFGGALVTVAGKRFVPQAYRHGVMEKMLPVEYDTPALEPTQEVTAEKPVSLELTTAGKASPMLRLSDNSAENAALWSALPPVYWVARVSRPKPAAEVLLVDPDPAKESRFGKMPVIALQQYGLGQVMFVGTDNTWRWRKNVGDVYYTALWGQIAQRVSLQRLLGVSKRTQLSSDRQNYLTGDRVTIYARLYSTGYEPFQEPTVKGIYSLQNGQGPRSEVTLRPIPEQPGLYRGEFIAPAQGIYQFFVEHDLNTPLDFSVTAPQFEFGETAMNEPLLRDLANASGGAFFREENLHALPDTIQVRTERVRSPLEVELWSSPLYFLLLLSVVTTEWVLRKMSHLK